MKFLLSRLNSTLILNCLLTFVKVCSIPSLMYWQQTKLLPQFSTLEFESLDGNEILHNVLPKYVACRLQLINLTFFNAFLIRSEVLNIFQGLLNNRQGFGVVWLKS